MPRWNGAHKRTVNKITNSIKLAWIVKVTPSNNRTEQKKLYPGQENFHQVLGEKPEGEKDKSGGTHCWNKLCGRRLLSYCVWTSNSFQFSLGTFETIFSMLPPSSLTLQTTLQFIHSSHIGFTFVAKIWQKKLSLFDFRLLKCFSCLIWQTFMKFLLSIGNFKKYYTYPIY